MFATSRHSRRPVLSLGASRSSGGSLPRRAGAAVLTAATIMATGAALAIPASADIQAVSASNSGNGGDPLPPPTPSAIKTTTAVTASPPKSRENDLVTYAARVSAVDPPQPGFHWWIPQGTVTFWVNGTRLCNHAIKLEPDVDRKGRISQTNSVAKCRSPEVPVGEQTVTAIYSGDDRFNTSRGTAFETVSERKAALGTTTTVTADPTTFTEGGRVTYLATVRPLLGKAVPTGTVTFTAVNSATRLCTAAIPLNGVGNAKCQSSRTPVGKDVAVIAEYSGGEGFNPSAGKTFETILPRDAAKNSGS